MDSEDFTSKKLSTKLLQQIQVGLSLNEKLTLLLSSFQPSAKVTLCLVQCVFAARFCKECLLYPYPFFVSNEVSAGSNSGHSRVLKRPFDELSSRPKHAIL